jgi:hypothetical protein
MRQLYPFYTIYSPAPNAPALPRGPRELDKEEVFLWNMRYGYGLYGMAVGASLGAGCLLVRRSVLWSIPGFIVCGVLGGGSGFVGGQAANWFFETTGRSATTNVLLQAIVGVGLAWALCGLGFGVGLALLVPGWSQRGYAVLAGTISGVVAAGVNAPLQAAIFGENDVNLRLPVGPGAQLMWLVIPAASAALLIAGLKPKPTDERGGAR